MTYNTAIHYPASLPLAQRPTPIQALRRLRTQLQAELGNDCVPNLWIKRDDLTGSVLSGNKVRKLEFIVAQALQEGCDTLMSCGGIQSNHCRATAYVAAAQGLHCHLLLRDDSAAFPQPYPTGNLLLDQLAGAEVSLYASKDYYRQLDNYRKQWTAHYERQGRSVKWIPTGGSDATGVWGYINAYEELLNGCLQLGFSPDHVITATGSGGTQAGLTVGSALIASLRGKKATPILGVAVCDDAAYFQRKVMQDISDWAEAYPEQSAQLDVSTLNIDVDDNYIGRGYAKSQPSELETLKMLARLEGIVLDPVYTGKAFHGLMENIKLGHYNATQHIVFVHTGGLFGLFAYAGDCAQINTCQPINAPD